MVPYPPQMVANPAALDENGAPVEGEPVEIEDPFIKYDMNEIFALINTTTSNLRELADDIGTFDDRIVRAKDRESRGFSVGNLKINFSSPFGSKIGILLLKRSLVEQGT